jgi:hypothetical protein
MAFRLNSPLLSVRSRKQDLTDHDPQGARLTSGVPPSIFLISLKPLTFKTRGIWICP